MANGTGSHLRNPLHPRLPHPELRCTWFFLEDNENVNARNSANFLAYNNKIEPATPLSPNTRGPPNTRGMIVSDWSSTISTARKVGRTRSCKFRHYPKTYLDVRTRDFFSSNLSSPSTQFLPPFGFTPSKWPTSRRAKRPRNSPVRVVCCSFLQRTMRYLGCRVLLTWHFYYSRLHDGWCLRCAQQTFFAPSRVLRRFWLVGCREDIRCSH